MSGLADLDLWLFRLGNAAGAARWLDAFFLWLTAPPHRVLWLVGLAALIGGVGGRRGRSAVLLALLAVALSDLVSSQVLKPVFDRLRPCFALPESTLLLARQARSGSFPSSHAANSFAAAVALFGASRALGWAGLLLAGLISYSRVYLGVHYPSDSLAGALIGSSISLLLRWLRTWLPALSRPGKTSRGSLRRSRPGPFRPIG